MLIQWAFDDFLFFCKPGLELFKIFFLNFEFLLLLSSYLFFKFRYFFLNSNFQPQTSQKELWSKIWPFGYAFKWLYTHWRGHRKCWKLNTLINIFSHSFAAQYEQYWSLEYLANKNSVCLSIEPIEDPVAAYNVCLHHCTVLTSASVRSSGWQMLKSMQILF